MRSVQLVQRAYLWAVAAATAICAINGTAQEATPAQTQNSNGKEGVVILVVRPHPSVIRIKGFDVAEPTEEVHNAQIRIADSLYDWIAAGLVNRFRILDRSLLGVILPEAELDMIFNDTGTAAQRLRLKGADLLIAVRPVEISLSQREIVPVPQEIVNVIETKVRVEFAARVVDARTGEVVLQNNFACEKAETKTKPKVRLDERVTKGLDALLGNESEVYKMITRAGECAVQTLVKELIGTIGAKVLVVLDSDSYILSAGKRDGLVEGMHLELQRIEQIPLPEGGFHRKRHPVGIVKVVSVDEQTCEVAAAGKLNASLSQNMQVMFRPCEPPRSKRK